MKLKYFPLEIKDVTEKGEFTGYASTFGNTDLGGDVIAPGAFTKTISEKTDHPVLWGHNPREVIGVNQGYSEDSKGLKVHGQLIMDVQRAREAYALMKAKAVRGLSIGFDTIVQEYNKETDVRTLKEVKLWEYSLTPFPMNPQAGVTSVKTADDLEETLYEIIRFKHSGPLSAEIKSLIEQAETKLSALRAAKAPEAAKQDEIAPEILHAASSISKLLRGEI